MIPAAYRPVLANRVFRRLITGFGVSYLGDGMSFVAVAWLAIELAPEGSAGLWVGGAVAAYTMPGVIGALAFGRRLRRVPARQLLLADNVVRGLFLGVVPLAWYAGALTPPLYVVLLAVSSLLHAWGSAGKYTLLAELLPEDQRLAANTLVSSLNFAATIAGPAIAGVLVTYVSSAVRPARAGHPARPVLDAVRHRRAARRTRRRRATATAALAGDDRDRDRLGDHPAAVRVRAADDRHGRRLHPRWRDLRAVRRALGDADAGEVAAADLAAMLAARSAALLTASPLGTALGGPLTTALGPRATLGGSGLVTVVLGVVACVLLVGRRQQRHLVRSSQSAHEEMGR